MEASDTLVSNQVSSMEDENLKPVVVQADVDLGTSSTVDPAVSAAFQQDASVVSGMTGMTDPGSLEENKRILVRGADGTVQLVDPEVPKQVILSDEAPGTPPPPEIVSLTPPEEQVSLTPIRPEEQAPLVVTMTPPDGNNSTVSLSALPDRLSVLEVPTTNGRTSTDEAPVSVRPRSVSPVAQEVASSKDDNLDDYIRSPEVQNAIVERSPGSRYVRFTEKLGSGASKDVFRAYDTQEGIEVAWNVVNLSGVPKSERNRIVNEVRLLERLHHHNIISFHGSWVNRERQEVNFVTEILSSGTLKRFINKVQVIRWKIAKRWAVQILNGLAYLHSQDPPVIHRDLKCENIFINGTSGDLRIGDLGLSTVHRNGRVLSVLGTPEFMAPDMYEESSYDEKVDIYAFGLCMLEIFTKEIPYSECHNPAQIYKKVSSGAPPSVLMRLQSHHAREFVLLCLGYKDENDKYIRPTASELLKHPFLEKRENDDDEVVVDLPLSQRAIAESVAESSSPTANRYPVVESSSNLASGDKEATAAPPIRKMQHNNSLDEDGDRFEEMPESEVNMRKVKVLMGRGHELEEDEEPKVTEIVRSVDENSGVKERLQESVTGANPNITGSSTGENMPESSTQVSGTQLTRTELTLPFPFILLLLQPCLSTKASPFDRTPTTF
jgi:WNK lysine deficient protein kinase